MFDIPSFSSDIVENTIIIWIFYVICPYYVYFYTFKFSEIKIH